ncbi:hypothetical protein N9J24_02490, partial [Bacteroidia bacterium]|nr:hypothetical protein [Bacteroidia bacterium]
MWDKIAGFILKYRAYCLTVIGVYAIAMGYFATKAELAYNMQKLIPNDDPDMIVYQDFKRQFGEDGNKLIIGFKSADFFTKSLYGSFKGLSDSIAALPGVKDVVSPARCKSLTMNDSTGFIETHDFPGMSISSDEVADSLAEEFLNMEFYQGRLMNTKGDVMVLIASLDDKVLNSQKRIPLINSIKSLSKDFGKANDVDMHFSGLPFVRTEMS